MNMKKGRLKKPSLNYDLIQNGTGVYIILLTPANCFFKRHGGLCNI